MEPNYDGLGAVCIDTEHRALTIFTAGVCGSTKVAVTTLPYTIAPIESGAEFVLEPWKTTEWFPLPPLSP